MLLISIHRMLKLIIIEVENILKSYLGNVLFELGRKPEAINDFTKAIELNPNYADAYFKRGKLFPII